jgi:hypothetical protein
MSIESELRRMAQEAATRVQTRTARLHRERSVRLLDVQGTNEGVGVLS